MVPLRFVSEVMESTSLYNNTISTVRISNRYDFSDVQARNGQYRAAPAMRYMLKGNQLVYFLLDLLQFRGTDIITLLVQYRIDNPAFDLGRAVGQHINHMTD